MQSSKRTAVIAAVAILIVIFTIGAFLILKSGAPPEDLSWVPTVAPYVDDRAGVLDYSDYLDLDEFCFEVELNNSCEIALLIVNTTQPVGINDYAIKTFEKNGFGQQGKDNGVLVVYSADEKAWRVVTGAGVSDILNGARLTELSALYLEPDLNSGDYSNGIKLFIYAIGLDLVDNYHSEGNVDNGYPISFLLLSWWQIGLIVALVVILTIATKGRILSWIVWIFLALFGRSGGGGKWGGGRTGGGGARGRS